MELCWTHLQIFKLTSAARISNGKYFSDKKSFPLSVWAIWVWLGWQCQWLRTVRILSHTQRGTLGQESCVLSVVCSSYHKNVTELFQSTVPKLNCLVSCLGWACRAWANIDRSFVLTETCKVRAWLGLLLVSRWQAVLLICWWLGADHCSDHTQYLQQGLTDDYNSIKRARVLHEVCILHSADSRKIF